MSSLVANKRVLPADSDTPDVDDGDTTVSAGDFWPVIKLADLRLAARITGGITTSRLMHVTTEAVAHVTAQLLDKIHDGKARALQAIGFDVFGQHAF